MDFGLAIWCCGLGVVVPFVWGVRWLVFVWAEVFGISGLVFGILLFLGLRVDCMVLGLVFGCCFGLDLCFYGLYLRFVVLVCYWWWV